MIVVIVETEIERPVVKLINPVEHPSKIRHEDFLCSFVRLYVCMFITLRGPTLDSETGWTGELWSNLVLLILEN